MATTITFPAACIQPRRTPKYPVFHEPVTDPDMLDCIEIDPPGTTTAAIIWLHGLGADGNDFVPIVPQLGLPDDHGLRFVFPNAAVQPVTINGGMGMRAWYDILGVDIASREDADGINASRAAIEALIARENARGIPANRIVLAGFSQGGAIALHAGLRHDPQLAGILALSTYLPLRETLPKPTADGGGDIPIFMAHGENDPVVPFRLGEASRDLLNTAGYKVAWHSYKMQHQVCIDEIHTIGAWLRGLL